MSGWTIAIIVVTVPSYGWLMYWLGKTSPSKKYNDFWKDW